MTLALQSRQPSPHRLTGVLEGVAHELDLLRAHALRLQDVCAAADLPALDPVLIRELQGLDLMSQRLEVLSTVVAAVIRAAPFDPAMDLDDCLRALPLADVAGRLRARAAGLAPSFDAADPGDFDLF